ncbi:MAG: ABC transporter ATP-binding protein [Eubacteriales bacterium]
MKICEAEGLTKHYPAFTLDGVSFALESGRIVGFIGRNGAGKSTTLGAMLGFVHPDAGKARFFGLDFDGSESEIKQRIGYVAGGVDYYPTKKLKTITSVTKSFYKNWNDAAYNEYVKMFALDENKTPAQLSAGMKVKYSLALALSHRAELLILDEPTSGLDPVSRDDLLDVFMSLSDRGVTIFFSTHITTDLDKCADDIVYIKNGRIIAQDKLKSFTDGYRLLELTDDAASALGGVLIGLKRSKEGHSAIIRTSDTAAAQAIGVSPQICGLEDIMVHIEKE